MAALTASLPVMKANARLLNSAYVLASSYINLAIADTDLISTKLQIFSINYDIAYSNYSTVITQARAEAQNQTLWRGILLGIGTGVLAGIAAAYIAPSTAAGWFALTLADVGTAAGSSCLQAIASSAIALAVSDAMTVRGSNLQPGGLSPDLLDSHIWKHVALMYRGTSELNSVLDNFHRNSILFEHLIAEMRVAIAGGDSPYSAEDILASVPILCGQMANMTTVTTALIQKATELISFTNSIISYDPNQPNITQMERDIWIMWMGTLSNDDSDILDLDNVEDHLLSIGILGSGGLLGVDFGSYTSEDDELAALAAARPQATTIQGRYDIAASQWIPPSP